MATDLTTLDVLQALHRDLVALREGQAQNAGSLGAEETVVTLGKELAKIWDRPEKRASERESVISGKITLSGEEYSINSEFRDIILSLSDETEVSELESARTLLDAQDDVAMLGRPLLQCGFLRFHQQRKYALDCLRLLLELDRLSEEEKSEVLDSIKQFVDQILLAAPPGSTRRLFEQCRGAMAHVRTLLKKVTDKMTAASFLGQERLAQFGSEMQTVDFSRVSLYQQHELLGVILSRIVEKGLWEQADFEGLLSSLKGADRYDALLVHTLPAFSAFVDKHAYDGDWAKMRPAMAINTQLSPRSNSPQWALPPLQAGLRAWWLVEYSGFFVEEPPEGVLDAKVNIDQEDKQKTKDFTESLKDGALDFLLALVADVKYQEWQDPARTGMRQWLQRKTSSLSPEWTQFSEPFQTCLVQHLEVFVDAFISNLPDVLRRLRVEEDEQRQLSQTHEHDLDLERFLIIIAYTYEDRPDAAMSFWTDPDSNLAGFVHWVSRRASTPLVAAFCEMLQAISESEACADAAHEFLMDEGHHASGKMRRSQSLTWHQIFQELVFFADKIREKPTPSAPHGYHYRHHGKPSTEHAEAEPESAMMLECYLRLIAKLATGSDAARQFLLTETSPGVIEILFQLASSPLPPRLRACVFQALRALLTRKQHFGEGHHMWHYLDAWMAGSFGTAQYALHHRTQQPAPALGSMERIFQDMLAGSEETCAFIQLLTALILPSANDSPLNDSLPFPETLGSSFRMAGIDPYVDFVMGNVFAATTKPDKDVFDAAQLRMLRLACLDFVLASLNTFNEELIVLANSTGIMVDSAVATTDLATYVRLHPFTRVMEWMFNDKVMAALFDTIHQEPGDVNNAAPDSALLQGILRAIQVISKVLELQVTYLDLVRPVLKAQDGAGGGGKRRIAAVANPAYASLEDGLVTHLNLVVDLGVYCGLGHAELTLASLKLLETVSASPRICSVWSSNNSRLGGRNKAIVALETDGEHEPIARSLISDLRTPLRPGGERDSAEYLIKIYILEFLHACLKQSPRRPTIAHLLLGFKCGTDTLSIEPGGAFDSQTSLLHALLRLLVETPCGDGSGIRQWMVALRSKAISILQILWSSPLSAGLVQEELRANEFVFHLLLKEVVIQPGLLWEGRSVGDDAADFAVSDGASTLVAFVTLRARALDYIAMELCNVAQTTRQPALKRRIVDALNGQISVEDESRLAVPTIFDLYDFQFPADAWDVAPPPLAFYAGLELYSCRELDREGRPVYSIARAKQVLLLKQAENRVARGWSVATAQEIASVKREEDAVLEYLATTNHKSQMVAETHKVLRSWTRLLLVMVECNDFRGTARTSFFLQCLQTILPSLEAYATDRPAEALELARLARVLLSKLDLSGGGTDPLDGSGGGNDSRAVGNLIGERLYQLFQICLEAVGKRAGDPELHTVYYHICAGYISGIADPTGPLAGSRHKAATAVRVCGERLLIVVCDDACGGDVACQTAALILLTRLVDLDVMEGDAHVVDVMNRLNFVGVLVDSLRSILEDWLMAVDSENLEQQQYHRCKLSLLLQLVQTRQGAKHVVNANLFRVMQQSALFAADPELQANPDKPQALEKLYGLLVTVTSIVCAAVVSRGQYNIVQGVRFLRDCRELMVHTFKRASGIGAAAAPPPPGLLGRRIEELADVFVLLVSATGFVEAEENLIAEMEQKNAAFFH